MADVRRFRIRDKKRDGFVARRDISQIIATCQAAQDIVISDNCVGDAFSGKNSNVISRTTRFFAIASQHLQEPIDERRISDVQIRAIPHGFFHAIRQVAKRTQGSLQRNGHHRADAVFGNHNVHSLGFQAAQHSLFGRVSSRGIVKKTPPSAALLGPEWRVRLNILGKEAALDNQPAGDVPVQRPDMTRTLMSGRVFNEGRECRP
ncbi:MAG: hypothetical protein K2Y37_19695 [Pirellulales bacterium]|nr:hypothetical protein [Pirellulales bacterium]